MNSNKETTVDTEKQLDDMEKFLKEAFCIDGECKYYNQTAVITIKPIEKIGAAPTSMTFKLTDSKRGTFYITMTK